jgi:UDP-2,3-diacylglucosamine hydrolase
VSTLFISDLHLDAARPDITALFLRFLHDEAGRAEALYILGDLFEAWVGDDEPGEPATSVREALRRVVDGGTPVFVMRGNRDFLFGPRFAAETRIRLLPDPAVINLYGEPTLLMHGDLLCSDDAAYQSFRAMVRSPAWQEDFLAKPLVARQEFAAKARAASQQHQAGAMESIMDVSAASVEATMAQHGVTRLIHGHTHRPAIHPITVNQRRAQRIVLGDWYTQGSVLRVDADGFELATLM